MTRINNSNYVHRPALIIGRLSQAESHDPYTINAQTRARIENTSQAVKSVVVIDRRTQT